MDAPVPRRSRFPQGSVARGRAEDEAAVVDSLIVCAFAQGCFRDVYKETAEILAAVAGWDVDSLEMRRAGERVYTLARLFNIREGWQPSDDTLPERLLTHPLADGADPCPELTERELRALVQDYYRARQWDEQGFAAASRLEQAGVGAAEAAALTVSATTPSV